MAMQQNCPPTLGQCYKLHKKSYEMLVFFFLIPKKASILRTFVVNKDLFEKKL